MRNWKYVLSQAWKRKENILRTDGRALCWSIRQKFRSTREFGGRHVFLVDNLPLALAATKGRANSPHFSPVLRTLCAYSLACNSRLIIRWIPSFFNPADQASRDPHGPQYLDLDDPSRMQPYIAGERVPFVPDSVVPPLAADGQDFVRGRRIRRLRFGRLAKLRRHRSQS